MKKIILSLGFSLVVMCGLAQNTLTGNITDQENNPLPGTTIFVPNINKGTLADANGVYKLSDLPLGKIKVQFQFIGYSSRVETIEINKGQTVFNLQLAQTTIEAEEVIVSGGYITEQHDNAVKIDVLKLDNRAGIYSANFLETLTKVPGVDMISKGAGVTKPVIRGLGMDNILVLNNNVRYENYQYSDHHPLGIDEFGIQKVEIIKGPASLLYGSDAVGGVINFINEKPAPVHKVLADFTSQYFSNSQGFATNAGVRASSKNFFGGIRFGQKSHSDYLQGGGEIVPNTQFSNANLKATAGYSKNYGTYKLFYNYSSSKIGLSEPEAVSLFSKRSRENKDFYQHFNTHLLSSENKIFTGNTKIEINSAIQNTVLTHYAQNNLAEVEMGLTTLTYEAKIHLPAKDKAENIIGIQGFNQKNDNLNQLETKLLPNATTNNYSVFSLLQRMYFQKLKVQGGLRYDYKMINTENIGLASETNFRSAIKRNYGSVSGSLGATYQLNTKLLFRSNFAAAFRTPNLAELTSKGLHEGRFELGQSNLTPQRAYEADFSLHFHNDNVTFDLAGFNNYIMNYIFMTPTADTIAAGNRIYTYKQNNATLYGGEVGVHFHPKQITWLHLKSNFSSVTGIQKNKEYLPFVPANKFENEINIKNKNLIKNNTVFAQFSSQTALAQTHPSPEEEASLSYTIFNIGFGITSKKFTFDVNINNLLDKKYIDHLSTLREVNFYNPGRNIVVSLKLFI